MSEVINNALIFVPVGIYLKLLFERLSFVGIVALSGTISLLFEIFQYLLALGRFDITDLMTNTLGGMIGVGVVLAVHGLFDDKDKADTLIAALLNTPVALTVAVVGLLIALN